MYNYNHYICSLPLVTFQTFPTGTCSNEALHRELNDELSPRIKRYETTLEQMVQGFHMGKIIAHSAAVSRTASRQLPQEMYLRRAVTSVEFWTANQWKVMCRRVNSNTDMNGPTSNHSRRHRLLRTKVICMHETRKHGVQVLIH